MHSRAVWAGVLAGLLMATVVSAQETTAYVFGTYYRCSEATEARADAIYKETVAPAVAKQVQAGHFTTAGWARHWMGGEWRRLEYFTGSNLDAMVDARDAYIEELMSQHAAANEEFSTICSSHDDYVWRVAASSQAPDTAGRSRAAVGVSTYFQCDSREDEADAIVKTAFAPVLNQHMKDGKIANWSWLEHAIGGKYRRALVLDLADHKAAVNYWNGLAASLAKAQPELSRRFGEICSSHSDYIWDLGDN